MNPLLLLGSARECSCSRCRRWQPKDCPGTCLEADPQVPPHKCPESSTGGGGAGGWSQGITVAMVSTNDTGVSVCVLVCVCVCVLVP